MLVLTLALPLPACDFHAACLQCKPVASGNKCASTLAYRNYCATCNSAGTACTLCNGARSIVNGQCSLPCRLLFGIGCRRCNAVACLEMDPAYANGRR